MIAYAITDPSTFHFDTLAEDMSYFASHADMIVYRDKETKEYDSYAKVFINEAKKYPFDKILLHGSVTLAVELEADGVHLTSMQFDQIEYAKQNNLFVIISTHTVEEALRAEASGADMITYSPIFDTPNKGKAKGIDALEALVKLINIPIIALGGILTQEQIDASIGTGATGFASIRFFLPK